MSKTKKTLPSTQELLANIAKRFHVVDKHLKYLSDSQ